MTKVFDDIKKGLIEAIQLTKKDKMKDKNNKLQEELESIGMINNVDKLDIEDGIRGSAQMALSTALKDSQKHRAAAKEMNDKQEAEARKTLSREISNEEHPEPLDYLKPNSQIELKESLFESIEDTEDKVFKVTYKESPEIFSSVMIKASDEDEAKEKLSIKKPGKIIVGVEIMSDEAVKDMTSRGMSLMEDVNSSDDVDDKDEEEILADKSVIRYPNGMEVTDIDLDKALDYQYGTDRDKDNSEYTDDEKQKAVTYWMKKTDPSPYDVSKVEESATLKDSKYHQIDMTDPWGGTRSLIVKAFSFEEAKKKAEKFKPEWKFRAGYEASKDDVDSAKIRGLYVDSVDDTEEDDIKYGYKESLKEACRRGNSMNEGAMKEIDLEESSEKLDWDSTIKVLKQHLSKIPRGAMSRANIRDVLVAYCNYSSKEANDFVAKLGVSGVRNLIDESLSKEKVEPLEESAEPVTEDMSDGWDEELISDIDGADVLEDIEGLIYEIRNTVRGYQSGAHTYKELGEYISDLASSLSYFAEGVSRLTESKDNNFKNTTSKEMSLMEDTTEVSYTADSEDVADKEIPADGKECIEEIPATVEEGQPSPELVLNGIANELSALIKDEWEAIEGYKSTIVNLQSIGGYDEIVSVLEEIAGEEYVHVGQLQRLSEIVAPQADKIADGQEEAEKQLAGEDGHSEGEL